MKITTSCHWLLACLLTQGFSLDAAAATESQSPSSAALPLQAGAVQATAPAAISRLTLPDEGPRYDYLAEGSNSLQFQEAIASFKHGEYALAREGFSALVKQDPDSRLMPAIKAFFAEIALREDPTTRGRSEAILQYRAQVRQYPKDPNTSRALWRIGDLYVEMGWLQEAIIAYEYATSHIQLRADADRSLLSLGVILESRERWVEAERAFESVRKRTSDDRVLRRSTLGQANALYALRRKREAQPLYDMLYQRWPDFLKSEPQFLQQYGDVLVDTNERKRARAIDILLFNLYPSNQYAGAALIRLGDSHRQQNQSTHAELFYYVAQERYVGMPAAVVARMRLAQMEERPVLSEKGSVANSDKGSTSPIDESVNASKGVTVYQDIAKTYQGDVLGSEALFHLAEHYELRGDPLRAIQVYQDVARRAGTIQDDPWPLMAGRHLTSILKPQLEAALKAGKDVLAVALFHNHGHAPEHQYAGTKTLLAVADTHRRLGFSSQASRLYQLLIRDRKAAALHESALIGLGESYVDQRMFAAARNVFENFRLQYPQSPQTMPVLRQLTTAMLEQGDRPGAIRLMRLWLRTHPKAQERGWMQLTLARTLAADHQPAEAVAAFEEAARHKFMQSQGDRLLLADLLTSLKKHQQAVDLYQNILASNPAPDQAEWARLQIVRNLATQKLHGPVRAVLTPGAGTGDPLLYRAAEAIQASIRVTTDKEGG
jgi:TolA-binding protein